MPSRSASASPSSHCFPAASDGGPTFPDIPVTGAATSQVLPTPGGPPGAATTTYGSDSQASEDHQPPAPSSTCGPDSGHGTTLLSDGRHSRGTSAPAHRHAFTGIDGLGAQAGERGGVCHAVAATHPTVSATTRGCSCAARQAGGAGGTPTPTTPATFAAASTSPHPVTNERGQHRRGQRSLSH